MSEVQALVAEALHGVPHSVTENRSSDVDDELAIIINALHSAGIRTEVVGDPASIPGRVAGTISWVLREASTNVLRHAHASVCRFTFATDAVSIVDDGVGFLAIEGNGITGMRQRISDAGGEFKLSSSAGGGTTIEVSW